MAVIMCLYLLAYILHKNISRSINIIATGVCYASNHCVDMSMAGEIFMLQSKKNS